MLGALCPRHAARAGRGRQPIHIHAGNRLETLAARLAQEMQGAPGDPLAPERIVVPHPTLGRWLTLELAGQLGIAAHLNVELPAQFAWAIMRDAVPTLPLERPFAPERLRWRIFHALAEAAGDATPAPGDQLGPGADAVRGYLADGDPRKRFELAERLAGVYDRCLLYRPDWIRAWEAGAAPHWQARLWQRLAAGATAPRHWVAAIDAFAAALPGASPAAWPGRVSFFGIAALSPSYLDMLRHAARHMEIHLFLLSPCREYWADIAPRRINRRRSAPEDPAEQHRAEGNELLAAWGKLARDTQSLLAEQELAVGGPEETYDEPPAETALGKVQGDVLGLRLAAEGAAAESRPAGADASIQMHVCHSPTREAEALHDRLLALFDEQPDIEPADVLVLTPHIEEYAPAIESVFAAEGVIPFNVSRPRSAATRATQAFLDLLALPGSRYGAEVVLAPLESAAVQARLGIDAARLGDIRDWVRDAGIRWGVDAAHRRDEGLPATHAHTWRFGLRRLLLGYAMAGDDVLFNEVAPSAIGFAGGVGSAEDYEALGRFVGYCEDAFKLRCWMQESLPAAEWVRKLREEVVAPFFADPEQSPAAAARETASVERLIDDLAEEWAVLVEPPPGSAAPRASEQPAAVPSRQGELFAAASATALGRPPSLGEAPRQAGSAAPLIPFTVLRDALQSAAASASRPMARLADGVTVAALATGQTFPAKVVCAMGMNDGSFPRSPTPLSFDVMAQDEARRGDRSVRDEDRLAFLEALLAARRCFLVSYTGRGLRDDAAIPPSVVVDELKGYLAARFPDMAFETRHPVQPFSPRYFGASSGAGRDDAGLFSYSTSMLAAARSLADSLDDGAVASRFFVPLSSPPAKGAIDLRALTAYAAAPAKSFLRDRLGLRLETDDAALAEDEPFELDGLQRWQVRDRLFSLGRQGLAPARRAALVAASGALPQGAQGELTQEDAQVAVDALGAALAPHEAALNAAPIAIDTQLEGYIVTGTLEGVDAATRTLVCYRIGSVRPKDRIEAWLKLLVWAAGASAPALTAAQDDDGVDAAYWACCVGLGSKGVETLWLEAPPAAAARCQLSAWLEVWRRGQSELLPLAPNVSWEYAAVFAKKNVDASMAREAGLAAAVREWDKSFFPDAYERLAFGSQGPFGERFAELAETLFVPLVGAARKGRT